MQGLHVPLWHAGLLWLRSCLLGFRKHEGKPELHDEPCTKRAQRASKLPMAAISPLHGRAPDTHASGLKHYTFQHMRLHPCFANYCRLSRFWGFRYREIEGDRIMLSLQTFEIPKTARGRFLSNGACRSLSGSVRLFSTHICLRCSGRVDRANTCGCNCDTRLWCRDRMQPISRLRGRAPDTHARGTKHYNKP